MSKPYRKYPRSRPASLIRDALDAGNRLPWWGAALMGVVMFLLLYWIFPAWIHWQWQQSPPRVSSAAPWGLIQESFERRVRWMQYLGIVLGVIGTIFAAKNYIWPRQLSRSGQQGIGFFSRLLGRFLD